MTVTVGNDPGGRVCGARGVLAVLAVLAAIPPALLLQVYLAGLFLVSDTDATGIAGRTPKDWQGRPAHSAGVRCAAGCDR